MSQQFRFVAFLVCALLLTSCSTVPSVDERMLTHNELLERHNWVKLNTNTVGSMPLAIFIPKTLAVTETIRVYIEGDGLAWINRQRVSNNPTPINPVALKLALEDRSPAKAYIGRPCQYLSTDQYPECSTNQFWTNKRFSREVIQLTNRAIDALVALSSATQVELVGYSGGGAIATLVAGGRDDVSKLITVAGNLDTDKWTSHHRLTPLRGSINPADQAQNTQRIPQWHFIGMADQIVPPAIAKSYAARMTNIAKVSVITIPEFTHQCCWVERWTELQLNVIPYF